MKFVYLGIILSLLSIEVYAQSALNFDGVNDLVNCGNGSALQISGNSITLESWIYPTAWKPVFWQGNIINKEFNNQDNGYMLRCGQGGMLNFNLGNNGWNELTTNAGTLTLNTWQHVAGTYDGSMMRIYVNGLAVDSMLLSTTISSVNQNLIIGNWHSADRAFYGKIDEVRIFNTARTALEIQSDMNNEICNSPANLVAYYKLNEGIPNGMNTSNTIAFDYSANTNNGTLTGFSLIGPSSNWDNGPILNPSSSYSSFMINNCSSYTSPSGNYTWTMSGTYMDTIPNSFACDSIMTINLFIGNATSTLIGADCISYTAPSGAVYSNSGTYLDTLVLASVGGCDSIITLNLTIGVSNFSLIAVECGSYTTPLGEVITSSGIYNDTIFNGSSINCDSIITMDVTINVPTSSNADFHTCQDSLQVSGVWYSTNQTFVSNHLNSVNCDSTHTLNLIFSSDVSVLMDVSACNSYTSPQGQVFTSSNVFFESYASSNTCDSIVEYTLTINESASTMSTLVACDSIEINGAWYYDDELISYSGMTIHACDSSHVTDVTVVKIDNMIVTDGDWALKALDIAGATYAWYNCDTDELIPGENNSLFTYSEVGNYKVEITLNTCSKFSECEYIIGESINEIYNSKDVELAPNPNNGSFTITLLDDSKITSYQIMNVLGEVIESKSNQNNYSVLLNTNFDSGLYYIKINSKDIMYMKQFIVE